MPHSQADQRERPAVQLSLKFAEGNFSADHDLEQIHMK